MAAIAHDRNAPYYDAVYELAFAGEYERMNLSALERIKTIAAPGARIVDFGAGTGRLAIPLAAMGYAVTAVEPSPAMVGVLRAKPGAEAVTIQTAPMERFLGGGEFDLALCVFTVIAYMTDEQTLDSAMAAAAAALRPGGKLILDIPPLAVFGDLDYGWRTVTLTPKDGDLFTYNECVHIGADHFRGRGTIQYVEEFTIRYWHPEHVLTVLADHGLTPAKDLSSGFAGTGYEYHILSHN